MNPALIAWFAARQRARPNPDQWRNPFDMPEERFRRHFRMSKNTVRLLCSQMAHLLEHRTAGGLSVEDQVLCALRFFATGSFQSSVGSEATIRMSQSSVSRCIARVAQAIVDVGKLRGWVAFPRTAFERAAVKQGFLQHGRLGGVIGCVDGTFIAIAAPRLPPAQKASFWCRKGYYALNTMVVCDSDMKILSIDPRFAGSCHDGHVWRNSGLRKRFMSGRIVVRDGEFLLGDSAYPLEPWLLTPVPGHPDEDTPEGVYNKEHAALRSTVERCIGLLKSRFRCLQRYRALHYGPRKAGTIVAACASLHNLCLEEPEDSDGDEEDDEPAAHTSRTAAPPRRRALYLRGRATRARQIAQLNISRSVHLQRIQRALLRARRH
ncbi:putative nuclease HARBI1 [Rhipicephalus sanguineus]|uniref:putative nuclease HARBI1 n=1 Tax=Rhipicephalus sanguineus TaxID=34632 RepID=UPI0018944EF5|nr:putative nuclease HARBI1 [Rhipicephalus sanguineus]